MLQVETKTNEYLLNLNKEECNTHNLKVTSVDDNGNYLSWGVEFCTSPYIKAITEGKNDLILETPLEDIKRDEYVVIVNYNKERTRIVLKPNLEIIRSKSYSFKITKKEIDGRNLKVKILSKESTNEVPWKCTYKGQPLPYSISPLSSDKSCYVEINLIGEILGTFPAVIKFTQEKSGNEIVLKVKQSNDSVEIIKAD